DEDENERPAGERQPSDRRDEPRDVPEEEEPDHLRERPEAGPRAEKGREERVARESERLEESGREEDRGQRRAEEAARLLRLRAPRVRQEDVPPRESARRDAVQELLENLARREPPGVPEDERLRVVVDAERLVEELVGDLEAEEAGTRGELRDRR